jgi:hypothetical protein
MTFVVMFPRQSGKNELQAQIEAFLLARYSGSGGEMVKLSPTWKPQSLNAMRRLEGALERNFLTRKLWRKEYGYIYRLKQARVFFLSASPSTNIVGATASVLLEVDEAQAVEIDKYDREIAPMAAAHNATRVFWGTAWTPTTLLARELEAAQRLERADGKQRVFRLTADEVAEEVPEYKLYVEAEVAKLGRNHPMVRSQYFSETFEAERGLFTEERLALMRGEHAAIGGPKDGRLYGLLVDVGGESPTPALSTAHPSPNPADLERGESRDSTAVTVVEIDEVGLHDPLVMGRRYEVVQRYEWVGLKQSEVFLKVKALAEHWRAYRLVVDATGIGAGLASFLEKSFAGKVMPFTFTQLSKSKLGWDFLAAVETGRFKTFSEAGMRETDGQLRLQKRFWQQLRWCEGEALPGPMKTLRWGAPDGKRDMTTGEWLHDDLVMSAALCVVMDEIKPAGLGESAIIPMKWEW